jgi:hypothetical protein
MLSITAPLLLIGLTAGAPVEGAAAQPAPAVLTIESLGSVLENMGYEVKTVKNSAGVPYYVLNLKRGTWTFIFEVSLSPNKAYLWLGVPLNVVPEGAVTGAGPQLLRLLEENFNIAPTFFSYYPGSKRLLLQSAMENRDVTPAKLRARIDAMQDVVERTFPLWDTSKWVAPVPPPEPVPPPQPER